MNFLGFANFYFVSYKFMKVVKIEFDTSYLSWGSSPQLASGSLLLVGIKPSPTVVRPPLLLQLLLSLLYVMDSLACVSLPVLGGLDVLDQRLIDVVGVDVQLPQLLSKRAEPSVRSLMLGGRWNPTGARTGGLTPWGLPCPLTGASTLPHRTTSLMSM